MRSITDIVNDLETQIAWRGPKGSVQGILTINRVEAIELLHYVKASKEFAQNATRSQD